MAKVFYLGIKKEWILFVLLSIIHIFALTRPDNNKNNLTYHLMPILSWLPTVVISTQSKPTNRGL